MCYESVVLQKGGESRSWLPFSQLELNSEGLNMDQLLRSGLLLLIVWQVCLGLPGPCSSLWAFTCLPTLYLDPNPLWAC